MDVQKLKKKLIKKYGVSEKIDVAFIMGSGLDGGIEIQDKIVISYDKVGMPKSKVEGFVGQFVFGRIGDKNVLKITRYHFYESGDIKLVRLPFEILSAFGVKTLVMATATGGVNPDFVPGDLMLICDHINLAGTNPLVASDKIEFVDMNDAYNKNYRKLAQQIAKQKNILLKTGVHAQFSGPSYETVAEVKFLQKIGVDTVSMSTAFDTICAKAKGINVLAFASVVNKAADTEHEITHKEVLQVSNQNAYKIKEIVSEFVKMI